MRWSPLAAACSRSWSTVTPCRRWKSTRNIPRRGSPWRVTAPEASLLYLSVAVEGYSADPWMVYPTQSGANGPIRLNAWVRILRNATPSEPAGVEVLKLVVDSDQFDFGSLLGALPRACGLARGFNQAAPQPVTGWRALDHKLIILRRPP